jgi:hypothetical protein
VANGGFMNEGNAKEQRKVLVSPAILNSLGISPDELKRHIVELRMFLGDRFKQTIPTRVSDFSTLHFIINLSMCLSKLKSCKGFEKHIEKYDGKQTRHAYFIAGFANELHDKVDCIELEPSVDKGKKADILVTNKGEEVYLECKGIETSKFNFTQQHEHMLSILRQYLSATPHQISITYKRPLQDGEIHELGKSIIERAKLVKADGNLIDNPEITVNVVRRENFGNKSFLLRIAMIEEDLSERCRYPADCYGVDGLTISIAGPKVDYKEVLRDRIRKSKRQLKDNSPFVLVIDGNIMLGALAENLRALSTAFQPKSNTRFSGAVLVESNAVIGSTRTDYKFNFVTNPFAKFPVSKIV